MCNSFLSRSIAGLLWLSESAVVLRSETGRQCALKLRKARKPPLLIGPEPGACVHITLSLNVLVSGSTFPHRPEKVARFVAGLF